MMFLCIPYLFKKSVLVSLVMQVTCVVWHNMLLEFRVTPEDGTPSGSQCPLVQVARVEIYTRVAQVLKIEILDLC